MRKEKRNNERFAYPARIQYMLDHSHQVEVHKAVTINISSNGLGLYVFSPLAEGQEIVIQGALPVNHRRARIRWIMHEHDTMYRMGLKFVAEAEQAGLPGQA